MKVVCIGGGAASFFFAANLAGSLRNASIMILEQGRQVLGKVAISGGGRCNVTHHCFDPKDLVEHYPRGSKELLGPFYLFGPADTVEWFETRGVSLKTESDGRMFPVADRSSAIIDCLVAECKSAGVKVLTGRKVKKISPDQDAYKLEVMSGDIFEADVLFIGSGSSKQIWQQLEHLGHSIVLPVPSLFTFMISDPRLHGLAGISVENVRIDTNDLSNSGPVLVTHKGLSGPSILRMSAFGARSMSEVGYKFDITVDFAPDLTLDDFKTFREVSGKKVLGNHTVTGLPKRLYRSLLLHAGLDMDKKFASLSNREIDVLHTALKKCSFRVNGQNRFKDEFVTAGGVDLSEIDMSAFSSKILPGVYLAGEVLNIDGVTGGFNFQAAWTGAWIAARSIIGDQV